jgi:hypothetical protein
MLDKNQIESYLKSKNIDVCLSNSLHGGVMSSVFDGKLNNLNVFSSVVVKSSSDRIKTNMSPPFHSRIDHEISADSQNLDSEILVLLREMLVVDDEIYIPKVLYHDSEKKITIQEDLRYVYDFVLLTDLISSKQSEYLCNGELFGYCIAKLIRLFSCFNSNLSPVELSKDQFEERGLELLFFYPNKQSYYDRFVKSVTDSGSPYYQLIPTDVHPKNMFFSDNKKIAFIDFGRSVYGDYRYVLPSFISHIYLNYLIGKIEKTAFICFLKNVIASYSKYYTVVSKDMCFYFGVELMHRSTGRYVDYFSDQDIDIKFRLINAANDIINREFNDLNELVTYLDLK